MRPLLEIKDLTVTCFKERIVKPVSLQVRAHTPLTILGETGCGKSLLVQAVMGVLPPGLQAGGSIFLGDLELLSIPLSRRRAVWGRELAILPQEPWLALDPTMRVLSQVREGCMVRDDCSDAEAGERAAQLLSELDLAGVENKLPFELSGGMAQRAVFAAASVGGAKVLLVDEPTKGLDAERWRGMVDLLLRSVAEGVGLLTITHDIGVARRLGGYVAVMRDGEVIERGPAERVLNAPNHAYTRRLLAADPDAWVQSRRDFSGVAPVLRAESLGMTRGDKRLFSGQDFCIAPGEIVGVTGPSGCGKSTFGDLLLGLLKPDAGRVWRDEGHARLRYQKLYQDPPAAFPCWTTIGQALTDLAQLHGLRWKDVRLLMERLRLGSDLLERLPGEVSGGELQRFAILRVLLLDPVFIFADEPTSRLDLITQQEIIELLVDCARERRCSILLVSHHEGLVEKTADRVYPLGKEREAQEVQPSVEV